VSTSMLFWGNDPLCWQPFISGDGGKECNEVMPKSGGGYRNTAANLKVEQIHSLVMLSIVTQADYLPGLRLVGAVGVGTNMRSSYSE